MRLPEQDLNKGEMKSDASLEWESAVGLILRKEKNLKAGEISAVKDKGTEFEREQNEYMWSREKGRFKLLDLYYYLILEMFN